MVNIRAWPDILDKAKVKVNVLGDWETRNKWGQLPDNIRSIFWHHDASPTGPSHTIDWIVNNFPNGGSGAGSSQLWMDYAGVWQFANVGICWHAGVVRGPLDSFNSVGLETDHTINESYSVVMLESIYRGMAALAKANGRQSDFMTFHKIEASPYGRKPDPWFNAASNNMDNWGNELAAHRGCIQQYIDHGQIIVPDPIPTVEDDVMKSNVYRTPEDSRCYSVGPGFVQEIKDSPPFEGMEFLRIGIARGQFTPVQVVSQAELDILKFNAMHNQAP